MQFCVELKVDGHRGELTIMRAARAMAAFEGRREVDEDHVRRVVGMSLRHRLRRDILEETATTERIEQAVDSVMNQPPPVPQGGKGSNKDGSNKRSRERVRIKSNLRANRLRRSKVECETTRRKFRHRLPKKTINVASLG